MRNLLLGAAAALFLFASVAARADTETQRSPPPAPPAGQADAIAAASDRSEMAGISQPADQDEADSLEDDSAPSLAPVVAPFAVAVAAASLGSTGNPFLDLVLGAAEIGTFVALTEAAREETTPGPMEDHWGYSEDEDDAPPVRRRRALRRREAREGFLFSFGLGGGSLHVSPESSIGAFDLGLRLGYGFSDRFQSFLDLTADTTSYGNGRDLTSWTFTLRGQTVLAGDRSGNGLNLNLGAGLGGVSRSNAGYYGTNDSAVGLALAGGLSYDARIGRYFSLSPEIYATWHAIPNPTGHPSDVASAVGFRINFLWYSR